VEPVSSAVTPLPDFQVLRSVVGSDPVLVMDRFGREQRAPEYLLHNDPMLGPEGFGASVPHNAVPVVVDESGRSQIALGAETRTEFPPVCLGARWAGFVGLRFPAGQTGRCGRRSALPFIGASPRTKSRRRDSGRIDEERLLTHPTVEAHFAAPIPVSRPHCLGAFPSGTSSRAKARGFISTLIVPLAVSAGEFQRHGAVETTEIRSIRQRIWRASGSSPQPNP